MSNFNQNLESLKSSFQTDSQNLSVEELKAVYTSKKGKLSELTKELSKLDNSQKAEAGKALNQLKQHLTQVISQKETESKSEDEFLDVTIPAKPPTQGRLHPLTNAIDEITRIFTAIGFTRVRYPEADWDFYAFEGLNMPSDHPARDEWETFFIKAETHPQFGKMVLTPHTSNGQVREMERLGEPPIRMINIAKCYRRQQDATHTAMFHQFEGLVVDQGINITHLKGTIDHFAQKFYGPKAKSRIRPFHFQFTEPSFEVDFSCSNCDGQGCRFCKSGWHEVGGAGMVHPNVLKAGGIDPERYTGFAFGWGIERTYTLKPGLKLDDIRNFYTNKMEFLRQF